MGTHSNDDATARTPETSAMHNPSVDEEAARDGACAQVHLPSGRMCTLRHGHEGSCEFISPQDADASLAAHKAEEGW